MERDDAERALSIIRRVVQETRDDLVTQNWGLIWMVHSITNPLSFAAVGFLVERRGLPLPWYILPLACAFPINVAVVMSLLRREQGIRSLFEWQLHGIWTIIMLYAVAAAAVLHLAGASPRLFCPMLAMISGIGFAMMGVVFDRRYLWYAVLFLGVMLTAPFAGEMQWYLMALVWWVALFIPGLQMYRENHQRKHDASAATRIL